MYLNEFLSTSLVLFLHASVKLVVVFRHITGFNVSLVATFYPCMNPIRHRRVREKTTALLISIFRFS